MVFFAAMQRKVELKKSTLIQMVTLLKTQQQFSTYMLAGFRAVNNSSLIDKDIKNQLTKIITELYIKQHTVSGQGQNVNYIVGPLVVALAETEDYQTLINFYRSVFFAEILTNHRIF